MANSYQPPGSTRPRSQYLGLSAKFGRFVYVYSCWVVGYAYKLFRVERPPLQPQDFHAKEVQHSWMIMKHLPSSSTYKMHSHASFGLGLTFFTISSTDLSAKSIHNKTFNGVLLRWLMQLIYPSSYTKIQISKQINQYELQNQSFLQEQIKQYLFKSPHTYHILSFNRTTHNKKKDAILRNTNMCRNHRDCFRGSANISKLSCIEDTDDSLSNACNQTDGS